MASFTYKALDTGGSVVTGELSAGDRGEALRQLGRKGLQPVRLTQSTAAPKAASKKDTKNGKAAPEQKASKVAVEETVIPDGPVKLKRSEVVLFTEELSDMLSAGLQLEPALRSMENREELGSLKVVSTRIRQLVRDGNSFSSALRKVSPSFGPLYCSLAAAGEASGALDTILDRQAHYLVTLQELQSKVILALIYPAFLVIAGVGVAFVFMTQLIPQLTDLIESTPGGKLPAGAKFLMLFTAFISKWWIVLLLILVAALILFKSWKDNPANQPTWDRIQLDIPLVGKALMSRFYVQFLETLANLTGNGLPLLRSLELTRDATPNLHIQSHLDKMIEQVGDGRSLSRCMNQAGIFSPLLIDMVSVGEQTGKIDQALRKASVRFDKELNNALQRIMALIMPVILLVMAGLIGSMAYLMMTAIFQTMENLGGR
ncbi:type II secretion system F family protein [Akkermansiaceae bacterium]|nr:type II secretion system F family protein [Akkermansiaceae bacterium]